MQQSQMPATSISNSARNPAHYNLFHPIATGEPMRNPAPTAVLTVPPNILSALHISANDPVHWEVRNGEAVLKAAPARRTVDEVAGMLAPQLKGRRIRWSAVAASAREVWGRVR
jgi:antitoxin component of MazEF toxin-antitoxin module